MTEFSFDLIDSPSSYELSITPDTSFETMILGDIGSDASIDDTTPCASPVESPTRKSRSRKTNYYSALSNYSDLHSQLDNFPPPALNSDRIRSVQTSPKVSKTYSPSKLFSSLTRQYSRPEISPTKLHNLRPPSSSVLKNWSAPGFLPLPMSKGKPSRESPAKQIDFLENDSLKSLDSAVSIDSSLTACATTPPESSPSSTATTQSSLQLMRLPQQVSRRVQKTKLKMNLMICGESGLGKSSFINMLFGASKLRGAYTINHKMATLEVKKYESREADFCGDFTVIETPGFGALSESKLSWTPLVDYIERQMTSYMCQEEQPDRSSLTDSRIHVCLYFLRPDPRLLSFELRTMQELSYRVSLVPIIAKADSLQVMELDCIKSQISRTLAAENIEIYKGPFAIMCGSEMIENKWARKYRWGTVYVDTFDWPELQSLLFVDGTLNLIDLTHEKFYARHRLSLMIYRYRCAKAGMVGPRTRETTVNFIPEPEMPSLELLSLINPFGYSFLESTKESNLTASDALRTIKMDFDGEVAAKEEFFHKKKEQLMRLRVQMKQELDGIHMENQLLTEEITRLRKEMRSTEARVNRFTLPGSPRI